MCFMCAGALSLTGAESALASRIVHTAIVAFAVAFVTVFAVALAVQFGALASAIAMTTITGRTNDALLTATGTVE
jgi:pheromone shutdown protein TraB